MIITNCKEEVKVTCVAAVWEEGEGGEGKSGRRNRK